MSPGRPLQRLLIERTAGNPFFLEESVRTLVEMGVLVGQPGGYRLAKPIESLQAPATVQAVLVARIDRLPAEAKRLLQTAAVIGTEVPLALLQAIADMTDAELHRHLAHLQAAEFLYETRLFPEREHTFKHALTHDVAYSGLLQERWRLLDARIVEVLEQHHADRLVEQIDRLAYHAIRGEVWDKAVIYLRQAGAKELARERFGLPVFPAVNSWGWLAWNLTELGAFAEAIAWGEEGARIAEMVDHPHSLASAYAAAGRVSLRQGDFPKAIPILERGLRVCQDTHLPIFFPRLASALGLAYTQSGRLAEGLALLEQAVKQSTAMHIVLLHALWLIHLGEGYRLAGRLGDIAVHREPPEVEPAETHYRQALADDLGMRPLQAHCHLGLGTLYAQVGQREQAHTELSTAIELYRAMEMTFWLLQAEAALAQMEG